MRFRFLITRGRKREKESGEHLRQKKIANLEKSHDDDDDQKLSESAFKATFKEISQ